VCVCVCMCVYVCVWVGGCVELAPIIIIIIIIIIITLYLLSAFLVSGSARAKPTWTQS
jgi:hypothetical protein